MARVTKGYDRGDSSNLPYVDTFMMFAFMRDNSHFMSCEMRGVKAAR